jgi:hypothetical protein
MKYVILVTIMGCPADLPRPCMEPFLAIHSRWPTLQACEEVLATRNLVVIHHGHRQRYLATCRDSSPKE